MNEKVNRAGILSKITEKLKDEKVVIGGNRERYTQEIINNVLAAFMDVLGDIIANGDTTILNGYMTIEPRFCKDRMGHDIANNIPMVITGGYKVKIKAGSKLKEACNKLNEKVNEQEINV